ncbi:MAG: PAS domain S-box protein, partial [Xanthobacteraceae bacterium]
MGALIRAYDWCSTPLGSPNGWPQGLKMAVRLLLRRSIGPERHPTALGQRGAECWAEIWDIIGPQIEQVMTGRGPTWHENQLVPITRNGQREDVYWTYSYSPIDEPGAPAGIGGVLVVCTETTDRVRSRERQDFRVDLSDALRGLDEPSAIMALAAERLGRHLGVDQANYYTIEGDEFVVEREWTSARSPGLLGRHRLADFGDVAVRNSRAGEVLRLDDADRQDGSGGFRAAGMGALISAPLHRNGRWLAGLHVHQTTPRSWTDAEVLLVREVAERTWAEIERARAATSLAASEARFQAMVASIDPMIWSARPDGWHDFYNQRWYEFTGVPEGSTDGEAWKEIFHPEDRERVWARWRLSLQTGDRYESEHRLRHRSGQYRWVLTRAAPVRDQDGRILHWFGTCTDIHDLVQARDVLARSHDELERQVAERTADRNRLWQLSADLMLVTTFDGIMTAVNPAWTALLGWTEQELLGR